MAPVQKAAVLDLVRDGKYADAVTADEARPLISSLIAALLETPDAKLGDVDAAAASAVGLAALNAFLQVNVTGPVLEGASRVEAAFDAAFRSGQQERGDKESPSTAVKQLRERCFRLLDIDGVSAYSYIPNIELFCLAHYIFLTLLSDQDAAAVGDVSLDWTRLRVHVWHYRLLSQPSLGPGSVFNKSASWTDVPTLEEVILTLLDQVEKDVMDDSFGRWKKDDRVHFLLEKANICITLGLDAKAKEAVAAATELNRFVYALSGALGKRTRYQEKSTSQLVVLAKSSDAFARQAEAPEGERSNEPMAVPESLALNDDTLLENIEYAEYGGQNGKTSDSSLPVALQDVTPDAQPQLSPLDQIILLTQATLKDAFSPADELTSEEIMPYAERVISDKSTNWQVYTQALLVRSRIEVHRSRTVERGVLQMQAVVDQVVVDTTATSTTTATEIEEARTEDANAGVPAIQVTAPNAAPPTTIKPTSFLRASDSSGSAPPQVRLQYIHALSSPPRWHLESELAYAWVGVGSLVSALEIFKRLRLWAEVALCLASSAAKEDEDGRGSGGEERARAVLRWRLFHRTGTSPTNRSDEDDDTDISELKPSDFTGPEQTPPPPNAPRLYCILGDVESDPSHYERAWELSNHRYARAQKSLAEHYLQHRDWQKARLAYQKAVAVNRLNPELWGRLGDINLRLGAFEDAAEAFGRSIASAGDVLGGEDARTWSNLGSALWSLYCEAVDELKSKKEEASLESAGRDQDSDDNDELEELAPAADTTPKKRDPATLLTQALAAYKRGASIAQDNWRIWENVITLASRVRPPAVAEMVQALQQTIRIRSSEDALDDDVLRVLLNEAVLSKPKKTSPDGIVDGSQSAMGPYEPPRGTAEKAVVDLLERDIAPLITVRSELWELIGRERVWRRDYAGAVDAAEKAWRAATGGAAAGGLLPSAGGGGAGPDEQGRNWLEDKEAWKTVVRRTDELVSVLENYGPEVEEIGTRWKGKARSAIRSVMGKGKESWEGTEEWELLKELLEELR
ncbi:TPR-like protein [Pleurostoma richardsiae]|uniref:TPR-like protein n=1 Tax=Pleurostoma richardsiae TaxID=41990 RepID=A0AA38RGJ4_9PEZI|nr:TPR-like protein [Pleurostoma richardsiae]